MCIMYIYIYIYTYTYYHIRTYIYIYIYVYTYIYIYVYIDRDLFLYNYIYIYIYIISILYIYTHIIYTHIYIYIYIYTYTHIHSDSTGPLPPIHRARRPSQLFVFRGGLEGSACYCSSMSCLEPLGRLQPRLATCDDLLPLKYGPALMRVWIVQMARFSDVVFVHMSSRREGGGVRLQVGTRASSPRSTRAHARCGARPAVSERSSASDAYQLYNVGV